MENERIWFADIEAYSLKYFKKNNDIKAYALIQKDLLGNFIFDVDTDRFLDKMFEQPGQKHKIFYHYGGNYDWRFFLSSLSKRAEGKKSHRFNFFAKEKTLYYMTYSIQSEEYIRDEEGKLIWTGKRAKNGNKKYKRRKYTKTFTFMDSFRHWPLPLSALGKAVGLEKLDYGDYDITKEFKTNEEYMEWQDGKAYEYLHRDVDIPIKFFKETRDLYDISDTFTLASSAFAEMCEYNDNLRYSRRWLKDVSVWKQIKTGFVGGMTWVNPLYQLLIVRGIYKYDVNSLYPAIMRNHPLPFGEPIYKETKFKDRVRYYEVSFKWAKAKSIPFLSKGLKEKTFEDIEAQVKGEEWENLQDLEEEYPSTLTNQRRVMSSTLLDFFLEWYEVEELETEFLYEFKTRYDMFTGYIDKWTKIKIESDDNPAQRLIAKLKQNTTFGRFAMGIDLVKGKIDRSDRLEDIAVIRETEKQLWVNGKTATWLNDNYIFYKEKQEVKEIVINKYKKNEEQIDDVSYLPIAEQITTLARIELLKPVMDRPDVLVYCDTDSLHTTIPMEEFLDIHPTHLGKWKFEGKVERGIYRRPKHYLNLGIEEEGKYTGYLLKGGGFNVSKYNDEICILPEQYLKETFVIPDGKKTKIEAYGKPIIVGKDYTFTMPKWYEKKWESL